MLCELNLRGIKDFNALPMFPRSIFSMFFAFDSRVSVSIPCILSFSCTLPGLGGSGLMRLLTFALSYY